MTAPQRLIEGDDEFERELIRSAHGDRPSPRALDLMLLGLGVEASKLPSAVSSSTAGAGAGGKIGAAMLAKWLVTGLAIGLAAIGGAEAIHGALEHRGRQPGQTPKPLLGFAPSLAASSQRLSPLAPREGALSRAQTASSAVGPGARPRVAAGPVAERAGARTPLASEPSSSAFSAKGPAFGSFALEDAQAPPSSLALEMRLLDAARRALLSGDPRSALSTLGSYERAFPNGALGPESSVLKVRALVAAGDRPSAQALGQRVIEGAPRSEHAVAVRAALGLPSNP
ncbi:MAG TPA: hypothetical protein VGJ91_24400 [Polyangiaceae bacterium]